MKNLLFNNTQSNESIVNFLLTLCKNREIVVPYCNYGLYDFVFKNKVHYNFQISNYYILFHYIKNNIDLLFIYYNKLSDLDNEIITNLSKTKNNPALTAAATLKNFNKKITKEECLNLFMFTQDYNYYYRNDDLNYLIYQDLDEITDNEILCLNKNNNLVCSTTKQSNLQQFNSFDAIKIENRFIIWNF